MPTTPRLGSVGAIKFRLTTMHLGRVGAIKFPLTTMHLRSVGAIKFRLTTMHLRGIGRKGVNQVHIASVVIVKVVELEVAIWLINSTM